MQHTDKVNEAYRFRTRTVAAFLSALPRGCKRLVELLVRC